MKGMKIKLQKEVLKHFREIFIQAKSELKDNVKKTGLSGAQLWIKKTRDPKDERKIVLTLSPKGKQLMAKAPKSPEGAIPSTLKKLNIEELEELNTVLTKFAKKMKVYNKIYKDIPLDY